MTQLDELKRIARSLGERAAAGDLDERELVTLFFQEGFFSALGYGPVGEDVRLERRTQRGRVDVTLRAFATRPVAVLEFKAPGTPLDDFVGQLAGYIADVFPQTGILLNGTDLWLFRCQDGQLLQPPIEQMLLADLTTSQARELYERLRRREVALRSLDAVTRCLEELRTAPLPVSGPSEAGGRQFLARFALNEKTPFGRLVSELLRALPGFRQRSEFARGAYEFWRRIYARQLDIEEAPSSWKPFLQGAGGEALYGFMFCLETAYAILSRVMLAKAMQDHCFPHIDALRSYARTLESAHERGMLGPSAHVEAVASVFEEARRQAFDSVFASDIFDWWQDCGDLPDDATFGDALAEAALAIFGFDFSPLRGDILGNLYQSYFDPETRLALGEFYTPPEVVDFILDAVGYAGPQVTTTRLLDPACGSGTFLVHALARQLDATQGREPAAVLRELIGGLRVIGFDVNPFACLMGQVNYAAQILPVYSQALQRDPQFSIPGIPILRTDSLRQETREGEEEQTVSGQQPQLGFRMEVAGDMAYIRATLPVLREGQEPKEVLIAVPRFDRAREQGLVSNVEEYFAALRVMFSASKEGRFSSQELARGLSLVRIPQARGLASFLTEAARTNVETMGSLRREYGDGRFHKTLEDTALAMVLKNDLQYDFIVMNPPYVRIQRIPEAFRRRWQDMYEWAQGNFDIFIPFIQRSVEGWLKDGGKLGFICSDRFLLANYAKPMRRLLPAQARVKMLLDLRDSKVFEKALNYPAICVVEKGDPKEAYLFPAGRAFADPPDGDIAVLLEEATGLLQRAEVASSHEIGTCADAFPMSSRHLEEGGWLLMPVSEREVFDALAEAATHRLKELTVSEGAVFEGLSTGADDVMVIQLLETRDSTVLVRPRGAGRNGIPEQVEIEKGILRRWFYGRNVERWFMPWEGWYAIWPYTDIEGAIQLMPSSPSVEYFPYAHQVQAIDRAFPLAWDYLTTPAVERVLRARERGLFGSGGQYAHRWYGFSAPRSLKLYTCKKICLPELTKVPDGATEEEGAAFGPGICGIAPRNEALVHLMTALVNSSSLFYWVKQRSVVHGGHYLKYDERFCREIPIKLPQTERERAIAQRLSTLAQELTETKGTLRRLEGERRAFPEAQAATLGPGTELYPLRRLVTGEPRSQTIDTQPYTVSQALDGRWGLRLGKATLFFPTRVHLQVIERWLHLQGQSRVPSATMIELRLPTSEGGCRLVLEALGRIEAEIGRLGTRLAQGEKEIDNLVADLYGLSRQHRRVIGDFLGRF